MATIELTDGRSILIDDATWPVIAESSGDSFVGNDQAKHSRAIECGEVDKYFLEVRRHDDGRMLIYGKLIPASFWAGTERESETQCGGELLDAGASDRELIDTIQSVGWGCYIPDRIVRECIDDLPSKDVDRERKVSEMKVGQSGRSEKKVSDRKASQSSLSPSM